MQSEYIQLFDNDCETAIIFTYKMHVRVVAHKL
jgi:hypothetical protein